MSYTLIERKELTEAASSISFSNIPQFYTDLAVVCSLRGDQNANNGFTNIGFNSSTSNFSTRFLQGDGSGAQSGTGVRGIAYLSNAYYTSNTFDSTTVYIPNYTGSTNKSFSADSVVENNATLGWQFIVTGVWSNTAAINSIQITPNTGNFVAGSSISLYGINRQQAIGAPKAIGGQISFANGHWYHTFTGSGTFDAREDLTVDALIIAGGGAGGPGGGGGGGAGGLVAQSGILKTGATPIVVGAGAPATTYVSNSFDARASGSSSALSGFTTAIGGGGGGFDSASNVEDNGLPGGSGGGGAIDSTTRGAGTSGQGNQGGIGRRGDNNILSAGGGGGAGGAGVDAGFSLNSSGPGGPGLFLPSWAQSTSTGVSSYYAGGGAGSNWTGGDVSGGIGGGGASIFATGGQAGVVNSGSGGGAANGAGGSGIVIIRYKA
jgi:hypothetical protein